MFDLRQRLFVIIGIGSGILVAIILLVLLLNREEGRDEESSLETRKNGQEVSHTGSGSSNARSNGSDSDDSSPTVLFTEASEETAVAALAKDFVERFGTYSNQNDNEHLEAVLPFVTEKMKIWLETQAVLQGGSYTGKTTAVVVASVTSLEKETALVAVSVQETLTNSAGSAQPSYRTGRVELVKQGEVWKADGFFWE